MLTWVQEAALENLVLGEKNQILINSKPHHLRQHHVHQHLTGQSICILKQEQIRMMQLYKAPFDNKQKVRMIMWM